MYTLDASLVRFIEYLHIKTCPLCCSKQMVDLELKLKQENLWVQLSCCIYGVVGRL